MRLSFVLPLLLLTSLACALVDEDKGGDDESTPGDSDGDGLSDTDEAAWGTDPENADSDADGYTDGEEVDWNTDPTDAADKPYQAGWPIDACRDDLSSTGNGEGDIVENFAFVDQFGETLHLHDFCNQVVMIVGDGVTDGAGQAMAGDLENLYEANADRGFIVITALDGDDPDDLMEWVDTYGITHPVVGDGDGEFFWTFSQNSAWPMVVLLDRGGVIASVDEGAGEDEVEDLLSQYD